MGWLILVLIIIIIFVNTPEDTSEIDGVEARMWDSHIYGDWYD